MPDGREKASRNRWLHARAERAFGLNALRRDPRSQAAQVDIPPEVETVARAPHKPARVDLGDAVSVSTPPPAIARALHLTVGFTSPELPKAEKLRVLNELDATEVKGCTKCPLCQSRTQTVFGEGDASARLMFVGEGPGETEDLTGRPFVGRAGELLEKQIQAMGFERSSVYIANIVKCRPPGNRAPTPVEAGTCFPYLEKQIEVVRPRVIVTLGLTASQYLLDSKLSMGKLRGTWQQFRNIKVMPTYHPAYILRNYTQQTRAAVWSDLQQVMRELGVENRASRAGVK